MMLKRLLRASAIGLVGCLLLSLCGFTGDCEAISERVLRLHVVAASDSAEDQAIKLKVRDAILENTTGILDGVLNTSLAKEILQDNLARIQRIAQDTLQENGVQDAVKVQLCEMYFATRRYETVTLPAGDYEALRVTIGEGKGQNWWCVVFPPMCLSGACEQEIDDVLTDSQSDIVTSPERYEVRFKLVEWYQAFRDWLKR